MYMRRVSKVYYVNFPETTKSYFFIRRKN